MELSPKTLREVEFREKRHGYHHEDVDRFLEEVASGLETLQERLRQAVERAQRAEAAVAESGGSDEAIRKTLVLAQRTADLAVQEAREQAARILAGAEQQAQSLLADAEEQGRRAHEDAIAEARAELSRLESLRAKSQQDVDTLSRWLDDHKTHVREALEEALAAVDRSGVLWPAPSTRSLEAPAGVPQAPPRPAANHAPPPPPEPEVAASGPETALWTPSDEERAEFATEMADHPQQSSLASRSAAAGQGVDITEGPNDQALDDFFDDNDELADDRRFGGRLRRRR